MDNNTSIVRGNNGEFLVVNADGSHHWTHNRMEASVLPDRTAMHWESKFYGAYRINPNAQP